MSGYEFLELIGAVPAAKQEMQRGYCCDLKMLVNGAIMKCSICGTVINYIEGLFDAPNMQNTHTYAIGGKTYINFGREHVRTDDEKIAEIHREFESVIKKHGDTISSNLMELACQKLYEITQKKTKKSNNRKKLFAALLFYSSIELGNILTIKEVSQIMGLHLKKGISKGEKFIIEAVIDGKLELNFNTPIHELYVQKYLQLYKVNGVNINTPSNRKFCINIVEAMIEYNIAYNAVIYSKCIAVVYYLIKLKYPTSEFIQKKNLFSEVMGVCENTYMCIYNTIISSDTQRLIFPSLRK